MSRRRLVPLLGLPALAALTLSVAACGGDDSGPTTTVSIPADALVVNTAAGLLLDKTEYTVASTGGKVTIAYVQLDPVAQRHTLVVLGAGQVVYGEKLEVVRDGETDIATYDLPPGEYLIYCDVPGHQETMRAKLIVT